MANLLEQAERAIQGNAAYLDVKLDGEVDLYALGEEEVAQLAAMCHNKTEDVTTLRERIISLRKSFTSITKGGNPPKKEKFAQLNAFRAQLMLVERKQKGSFFLGSAHKQVRWARVRWRMRTPPTRRQAAAAPMRGPSHALRESPDADQITDNAPPALHGAGTQAAHTEDAHPEESGRPASTLGRTLVSLADAAACALACAASEPKLSRGHAADGPADG